MRDAEGRIEALPLFRITHLRIYAMSMRRKNQAQPLNRRRVPSVLQVVPRNVVSAAGQSVTNIRPTFLRYVDLHPALFLLTGVAIVALVGVIYLTQVTAVTNANYTLQALQSEHTTLLRQQQDLQLEIAKAQSLENIEKKATNDLHMVPIGDHYEYLPLTPGPIQSLGATPVPTAQLSTPSP